MHIIWRLNCIDAASGIVTLSKRLSGAPDSRLDWRCIAVHYTTSCNTQSSAPEDVQNNFPKHVELTGITNKPLLLHLVACLYYLY